MRQNSIIPQNYMLEDLEVLDQNFYMDDNVNQKNQDSFTKFLNLQQQREQHQHE